MPTRSAAPNLRLTFDVLRTARLLDGKAKGVGQP